MTANIIGGPVEPWVQSAADALLVAFPNVSHISTYNGHSPSRELALDIFPRNKAQGDAIAQWAIDHIDVLGIDYVIWLTRIWNPEILVGWRGMTVTGNATADHLDHVHLSFVSVAPAGFVRPRPKPLPEISPLIPKGTDVDSCILFGIPNNGGVHLALLNVGVKLWIHTPAEIDALVKAGVQFIGESVSLGALPSLPEGELGDPDPVPGQS